MTLSLELLTTKDKRSRMPCFYSSKGGVKICPAEDAKPVG